MLEYVTKASVEDRLNRLPANPDYAAFRQSGLAFHGTSEIINAKLHVGGTDQIFWTAETPAIAQAYIPLSGACCLVSKPLSYQMNDRITPDMHSFWGDFMRFIGHDAPDVEYDACGFAKRWTIKNGHPTYGDACERLASMGYDLNTEPQYVMFTIDNGTYTYRNQDWRKPGRVFVTLTDHLNIFDHGSEGDLLDPSHRWIDLFRRVEDAGFDGIRIGDFAQCGRPATHIGHPSIGLFSHVLPRLEFLSYDAVHCDLSDYRFSWTPEFQHFASEDLLAA